MKKILFLIPLLFLGLFIISPLTIRSAYTPPTNLIKNNFYSQDAGTYYNNYSMYNPLDTNNSMIYDFNIFVGAGLSDKINLNSSYIVFYNSSSTEILRKNFDELSIKLSVWSRIDLNQLGFSNNDVAYYSIQVRTIDKSINTSLTTELNNYSYVKVADQLSFYNGSDSYYNGYDRGHEDGYNSGHKDGYELGHQQGMNAADKDINALASIVPSVVGSIWGVAYDFLNIEVYGINIWSIIITLSSVTIGLIALKVIKG